MSGFWSDVWASVLGRPSIRQDGFAGFDCCPLKPCYGTLADTCAAAGDCAVLALSATAAPDPVDLREQFVEVEMHLHQMTIGGNATEEARQIMHMFVPDFDAVERAAAAVREP